MLYLLDKKFGFFDFVKKMFKHSQTKKRVERSGINEEKERKRPFEDFEMLENAKESPKCIKKSQIKIKLKKIERKNFEGQNELNSPCSIESPQFRGSLALEEYSVPIRKPNFEIKLEQRFESDSDRSLKKPRIVKRSEKQKKSDKSTLSGTTGTLGVGDLKEKKELLR